MPLGKTKERLTQQLRQGLDEVEQLAAGVVLCQQSQPPGLQYTQYTYRHSSGNLRTSLWHMQRTTARGFGSHDPGPNEVASLLVSQPSALH